MTKFADWPLWSQVLVGVPHALLAGVLAFVWRPLRGKAFYGGAVVPHCRPGSMSMKFKLALVVALGTTTLWAREKKRADEPPVATLKSAKD